ncbi:MAG: SDR family NAD(P)-dependent oxidoreductase, partial [Bacteroidetes bacterium]
MSNKVWLITGVSTGLGRFLAEAAAQKGYTVVGTVRKQEQIASVDALVPGKTFGYLLDVNKHAQVEQVVEEVAGRFGRIDVLVNNAGYGLFGAVEEVSIEEAREQLETNVFGALAMTQAVLPLMRAHQSGHILQISSQAGIASTPGLGIY